VSAGRLAPIGSRPILLLVLLLGALGCQRAVDHESASDAEAQPAAAARLVTGAAAPPVEPPDAPEPARPSIPLPEGRPGFVDPVAALPYFAAKLADDGYRFPSPYHYHEWRRAAGLRHRPTQITTPTQQVLSLEIAGPSKARVVLLIDDLGNASWALRRLAALPHPVNGAVLPHTPHAALATRSITSTGGDVLLHLPLEPRGYPQHDPGRGALFVTMPAEKQRAVLNDAWASVPGAVGLNNHMGSLFTGDAEAMASLAGQLQERDTFFIDSRTTPASRALGQMIRHGIPALGRTHFLDHDRSHEAIEARLEEAAAFARRNGVAVVIGHPNRSTLEVLEAWSGKWAETGVQPVALRDIFSPE
jgi:polysaccharide deacetylase 2 family uncharacterized protein YibQ